MENFSNAPIDINSLPKFEEVNYTGISSKFLVKSNIYTGIFLVVIIIAMAVLWYFGASHQNLLIGGIVVLLFFSFRFWNNFKKQNNYGFALREKDVLFRRGFIVNAITIIPFNRIQHVSVSRDAFDKMLNISSLQIYTAGGGGSDINIPGLKPDLALSLKEALSTKLIANDE
ncbi:hypothetical protein BH23BAC2_BH23BAC2_19440 [soil metagenome]